MESRADSLKQQVSLQAEAATLYKLTRRTVTPDTLPRPETAMQVSLAQTTALPPGAAYTATGRQAGAPEVSLSFSHDTVTVRARAPATATVSLETVEEATGVLKTLRAAEARKTAQTASSQTAEEEYTEQRQGRPRARWAVAVIAAMLLLIIWRASNESE